MTTPLWCLFVGLLLPYVWPAFTFGERSKLDGGLDNNHPRIQQSQLQPGPAARAVAASANAFEAIAVFAPAVLVNHVLQGDPSISTGLAVAWVVFRVLHGLFYVKGIGPARSGSFAMGMLCALGLILVPALGIGG
ncbi:MAG: MAPEG family protein [Alphaproteobacteria bacterium]|nr:MAPEG family protein [Alphaproteobacteria bacterium]